MKNRNSADFAGCLVTALLLLWFCSNVDIMQSIIGIVKVEIEDGLV